VCEICGLNRILVRIAKGLIRHLDNTFNYWNLQFTVERIRPSTKTADVIRDAAQKMTYVERGNGVFRCLYGFTPDESRHAMFFLIFFDAVGFCVTGCVAAPKQPVLLAGEKE